MDFVKKFSFARTHKTLRVTLVMEAGISDHVWSLEEIIGLLDKSFCLTRDLLNAALL